MDRWFGARAWSGSRCSSGTGPGPTYSPRSGSNGLALPSVRPDALRHLGLHPVIETVEVEAGARAVGGSPVSLSLRRDTGATVIAAVRRGKPFHAPDPQFVFEPGDVVVLVGDRAAI